ncbi:MAG: hypothetical protein K0S32_2322 [Bacteroidetes bacterium]|jgi:hypothetical protein|nr:hypothetical protein [Bacteroidota bacterium]
MKNQVYAFKSASRYAFIILLITLGTSISRAQILTLDELIEMPTISQEKIETNLESKGWKTRNVEYVTDSNLVRRSWMIDNKYNTLKSYVQLYDFLKDNEENTISYQFSDRKAYDEFKELMKKTGFKEISKPKKKKKKKNEDKNIYKEKEDLYYSEKKNSLISLKEVFVYGMNTFVLYSYKASSRTAKDIMAKEK